MYRIIVKEDTKVVEVKIFDHKLGKEQVAYGEAKAIKLDRFESNEDSWITLTDSYRSLTVPKIDVIDVRELKGGKVIYRKREEKAIASENSEDLAGISSS
jgi:hypothetical protein